MSIKQKECFGLAEFNPVGSPINIYNTQSQTANKKCSELNCLQDSISLGLCRKHYHRQWYLRHMTQVFPEKIQRNPFERRWKAALYECNKRKKNYFAWKITLDEFEILCEKSCTYCRGALGHVEHGKGLDRINHKKDYVIDNVLPCCRTCNRIRGDDLTVAEARSVIRHLLLLRSIKNTPESKVRPAKNFQMRNYQNANLNR